MQPYLTTLICDGDEESLLLCDAIIDESNTQCNAAEFACLPRMFPPITLSHWFLLDTKHRNSL